MKLKNVLKKKNFFLAEGQQRHWVGWGGGVREYLVHGSQHLGRVGDALHRPTEDVQWQLQPLQDLAALAV